MSSYHCPHCNADLKEQPFFTADDDSYICDVCGEFIYDSTTDIKHCECCDAILNGQDDYEDWGSLHTCSECGTLNVFDEEDADSPLLAVLGVATAATKLLSNVAELTCNIAESKLEKQRAEESRPKEPKSRPKELESRPGSSRRRQSKPESEGCFTGCLFPLLAFTALMLTIILFVNRPDLALKTFNLMTEIIAAALELVAKAFEDFFSNLS